MDRSFDRRTAGTTMIRSRTRGVLAILLLLVVVSCSDDGPAGTGVGVLRIHPIFPSDIVLPQIELPNPDSLRVEVFDSQGVFVLAASSSLPDSGDASLDVDLAPGEGYALLVQAEAVEEGGRVGIYVHREEGISIQRSRRTDLDVVMAVGVPDPPGINGEAGEASYLVSWNRIPEATGYLLRETLDGVETDFATAETSRVFTPGEAKGVARLSRSGISRFAERPIGSGAESRKTTRTTYRVRAELPLGPGLFSDSSWVDLDRWFDLPSVVEVDPADGATGVSDETTVLIRFDREMDPGSLEDTLITLSDRDTGVEMPCGRAAAEGNRAVLLTPTERLSRGQVYRIRVSTSVEDGSGRPLDQDPSAEGLQAFISDFEVEPYDPLRVIDVDPSEGSFDIDIDRLVVVRFNRAVDPSSVTAVGFQLSDSAGAVPATRQVIDGGLGLQLRPSSWLSYGLLHAVRVDTTLKDLERGEPLDQEPSVSGLQSFQSSFQTVPQPRGPRVIWSVPLPEEPHHPIFTKPSIDFDRAIDPATALPGAISIQKSVSGTWFNIGWGVTASSDSTKLTFTPSPALIRDTRYRIIVAGRSDGLRDGNGNLFDQDFYSPGFQSYEAEFMTEQNVRVLTVDPLSSSVDVSWDTDVEIEFSMPVRPESVVDTTFSLTLDGTPVGATLSVAEDSLSATLTPVVQLQGYRNYQVTVRPGVLSRRGGQLDQNWSLEGHQSFTSSFRTIAESTPPQIVSVEPLDGAADVPNDAIVRVVFSEPVRPTRVIENVHLTRGDSLGAPVAGTVAVTTDSLSATFTPADSLDDFTQYHVHVETWVTDPFGNRLDQDLDEPGWQKFHSIFTTRNEQVPPKVIAVEPIDGTVDAPIDGNVRIDFSESMDQSSLPGAVRVESAGSVVDGSLSFEEADQTVVWTPSATLRYSRTYSVVVDSMALDLAGNRLDQEPSTPRFDPFESSFTTVADTIPPDILTTVPEDGTTDVPIDAIVEVTFTEPIDATTVNASSVAFNDSSGASIASTRVVAGDGRTVTITPAGDLEFDSLYRILVTTTLTDTSGVPFDHDAETEGNQPFAASFRTEIETIAPRVEAMLLDGAEPVGVDTRVRIVFSEPVNPASVDSSTYRLVLDGLDVPATRTVSASGDTAFLQPVEWLAYESIYQVVVEDVRDLVGNLFDQDPATEGLQPFEGEFETGSDFDAPWVSRSTPADGATGVDPTGSFRLVFSEPMDTVSFSVADPGLFLDGAVVSAVRTGESGDSAFVFDPVDDLQRGRTYEWRAGTLLTDKHGNALDQDPLTGGQQEYSAHFEVGDRPIVETMPGLCSVDSSPEVLFDASESVDPDGEIIKAIWNWGDGTIDSLDTPAGLIALHTYACTDSAGCDGADNDGDGMIDEDGSDGCDESYRIILTLLDDDGFTTSDTTGVSFCAFQVVSSDPIEQETGVDTLITPSVFLSRPVDPASVDSTSVWLALENGGETRVPDSLVVGLEGMQISILPDTSLLPDTTYVVHVATTLVSAEGDPLDQVPCQSGLQDFVVRFRTVARPPEPPHRFVREAEFHP